MTLSAQGAQSLSRGIASIAIAVDDASSYSKTFIRQHIQKLSGGRTVVLQTDPLRKAYSEKPIYYFNRNFFQYLWSRFLGWFKLKSKVSDDFSTFCERNHVGCVLAEFGYVGIHVYGPVKALRLPMVCYFRGSDASKHLSSPRYVHQLKEMVRQIDGIIAVSQHLIDNLAAHGVVHANSLVIPSGVNTEIFKPGVKESHLIVSIGRFIPKKEPKLTIRAFAKVAAKFPEARLEMVGDGKQFAECESLAIELGIAGRVVFHGAKPHAFVCDLLGRAGVYIQHSVTSKDGDSEGMPSSIQEAMAAGAVVVTTRHAGIPDHIIDGVNGRMVAEHDFDGYIAALESVLANPLVASAMSKQARTYAVEHLDHTVLYRRLEQHLALLKPAQT